MAGRGTQREHAVDNLRTFLTCLVIVHHTAIPYGGAGSWLFRSAIFPEASPTLLLFNAIDQSFFMGLFFWVSGRMSAKALQKVSRAKFWRGRMIRLGIPTLFYTLLVQPVTLALASPRSNASNIVQCFASYWKSMRDVHGSVWYTATLLLFDSLSAACHHVRLGAGEVQVGPAKGFSSRYRLLGIVGLLGVAAVSFGIRVWYPVGSLLRVISVQPAYLAQYFFAYKLGQLSWTTDSPMPQRDETKMVQSGDPSQYKRPERHIRPQTAILVSALTFHLIFVPQFLYGGPGWYAETIDQIPGGFNVTAFLYALWNEFSFYLVGSNLVHHFRRNYGQPATSWLWRSRYSYAAFLVHAPVSVSIEVFAEMMLSRGMADFVMLERAARSPFAPVVMTVIIGGANVCASFLLGRWLIEAIPIIQNII